MGSDINSVVIIGRLVRDAEIKQTGTGMSVTKFTLANNYGKKSGESWETLANFFDVILLGSRGEKLIQYLSKGKQVAITGELRQKRWEQDGNKRFHIEIIANSIELLGGQGQQNSSGSSGSSDESQYDDEVPF